RSLNQTVDKRSAHGIFNHMVEKAERRDTVFPAPTDARWLQPAARFWEGRLDALERALCATDPTPRRRTMSDYGESPERGTVRMQRILPGPIERVWEYLVDSEKRSLWFAGGAMDLRAGGRGALTFHPGGFSPSGEAMTERYKKHAGKVMNTTILR